METVDLSHFNDDAGLTLILGGPDTIAAGSLSEILAALSGSLQAIGNVAEPFYDIEVRIDDIRPGSIKISISLKKTLKVAGLVGIAATAVVPGPRDIIGGLFSSYLYDKLKPQERCSVHVRKDNKVIVRGSNCGRYH